MPSIRESMGADLTKYSEARLPVMVQMVNDNKPRANPFLRCPLPPFNSDPDTQRQFDTGTQSPKLRVIPLPALATTATTTASTATSSSSSSSTSVVPVATTLTAKSITIATPVLAPGGNFQTSIAAAKSFQLLGLTADARCEVRIYGTAIMQAFDAPRAEGDPVPAEIISNIVTCTSFDELPYTWAWQNRMGANQDTPQTVTLYVTVFNTSPTDASNVNIAISYLPLES